MNTVTLRPALLVASSLLLFACQKPGENLQSNVYSANQVNQAQNAKTVNIIMVTPAQIEVDNTQAKKTAQVVGGVLGAVGGGVLGNSLANHQAYGTVLGGVGGGAAGVAAGSLVSDKTLVEGVSITYVDVSGRTMSSAQVGKVCDYQPGTAVVISTSPTETRIQPNTACPAPVK